MEVLVANYCSGFRREIRNGREHIVVTAVLIVPGVLNGSQGPLLYPLDEIQKSASAWNGMPLIVGHRMQNGSPVSAFNANSNTIGTVQNVTVNGKITAEAWFDVEKTNRVDSRILDRLEAGSPIELSTGLSIETQDEPGT